MKKNVLKESFDPFKTKGDLLHDSKEARIITFYMPKGNEVPAHKSTSRVFLYCAKGKGSFLRGEEWIDVEEGDLIPYEPLELHGMRSEDDMIVLAIISPGH